MKDPEPAKYLNRAAIRILKLLVESVVWFCKLTMVAVTIIGLYGKSTIFLCCAEY
jgi:hypothetical protein